MKCPFVCCVKTDHAGSKKKHLKHFERIVRYMGHDTILLKQHSALLLDSKLLIKFSIELVEDFTASLAIDCHCLVTVILKLEKSEKTMSGVECDLCCHFGTLQVFLIHLLRRCLTPRNIIVTVYCPICCPTS